jgi:hypothetical protein
MTPLAMTVRHIFVGCLRTYHPLVLTLPLVETFDESRES